MSTSESIKQYLLDTNTNLDKRAVLIDLLTVVPDRKVLVSELSKSEFIDKGMELSEPSEDPDGSIYQVTTTTSDVFAYVIEEGARLKYLKDYTALTPPVSPIEKIKFTKTDQVRVLGDMVTISPDGPIETTVGRFLLNYSIFFLTFKNKIPYWNDEWDAGDLEGKLAKALMDDVITPDEFYKVIDHIYFLCHFTELSVPTLTEKALVTDPKLAQVKKELLEKHKDELNNPKVVSQIETQLIQMDKDWLENDPSSRFYKPLGKKSFNVQRKKLHIAVGGIESFSDGTGKINFLPNSLSEGWTKKDFPVLCNEIRKGSYDRGAETQKGGELTKFVVRIFQNVSIKAQDCGTVRGMTVEMLEQDKKDWIGRYQVIAGKPVLITEDSIKSLIGKTIKIRTPLYCETKNGLCYKCAGEVMAKLDVEALGMLAIDVTSTFLSLAMAAMHGTKIELKKVNYQEYFTS